MESTIEVNAIDQVLFNRIVDFIFDNNGGDLFWSDHHWYIIRIQYSDMKLSSVSVVKQSLTALIPFAPSLCAAIVSNYKQRYEKANPIGSIN